MSVSRLDLIARPNGQVARSIEPGMSDLRLSNGRAGVLYIPDGEIRGVVVALHGAGGQARAALDLMRAEALRVGLVVLAPASGGSTWAMLHRGQDPDTPAIDTALSDLFAVHPFAADRVSVSGFSDGGSYALTLGLANGDLFQRVVAFSPGFELADRHQGRPRFFVSHGVHDRVLPIDRTSRRIVPALRQQGYDVTYREFEGGHVVPTAYLAEAADWLVA